MRRSYILNALPGACLPANGGVLRLWPLKWSEFANMAARLNAESAVGHEDTAAMVSALAGMEVPFNRVSVPEFVPGDTHLLALYRGPRLPEGSTTLPEGATLVPYLLDVETNR